MKVGTEWWRVPRGFGREYQRHAQFFLARPVEDLSVLVDMLARIGYAATESEIASWTPRRRVEASVYSANVSLRASDNRIQAHPDLPWLPTPWSGPLTGAGIWSGPSPTVIS